MFNQLKNFIYYLATNTYVAIDTRSTEKRETLRFIASEVYHKRGFNTYYWCYGNPKKLEVIDFNEKGIRFEELEEYNPPNQVNPLFYLFDFIQRGGLLNYNQNGESEYSFQLPEGVFIIDGLEPLLQENRATFNWDVVCKISFLADRLQVTSRNCVLIGDQIDLPSPLVRKIPHFQVDLPDLNKMMEYVPARLEQLTNIARSNGFDIQVNLTDNDKEELCSSLLGQTLEEALNFLTIHLRVLKSRGESVVDNKIIQSALDYKIENLKKQNIELQKTKNFGLGGLENYKNFLEKRKYLFKNNARSYNLPFPKGVLLAGPPGTGKSMAANHTAHELNLPLIRLDIASSLGSLVGESEANIRQALKTASAIAPCVLWLDEIDKALVTSGDSSGVSQRIFGQLLTFMQENETGVFVLATANRVDILPPEFKRKGRFDEQFYVGLPTFRERLSIINLHAERFGCVIEESIFLEMARATNKFSGSELEACIKEAAITAYYEGHPGEIYHEDLVEIQKEIVPLYQSDYEAIRNIEEWARQAKSASLDTDDTDEIFPTEN